MTEQWKVGNEFLPFHPDASHVPPDYRDGWNACYRAATARRTPAAQTNNGTPKSGCPHVGESPDAARRELNAGVAPQSSHPSRTNLPDADDERRKGSQVPAEIGRRPDLAAAQAGGVVAWTEERVVHPTTASTLIAAAEEFEREAVTAGAAAEASATRLAVTYHQGRDDAYKHCAARLRELSGGQKG